MLSPLKRIFLPSSLYGWGWSGRGVETLAVALLAPLSLLSMHFPPSSLYGRGWSGRGVETLAVALLHPFILLTLLISFILLISFAIQETIRPVTPTEVGASGETLSTNRHRVRAARMKATAGRRSNQAGNLSASR